MTAGGWARGTGCPCGKCRSRVLEVPDSLKQSDGDKLWLCRWDTGESGFPRKGGADL